MQVNGQALRRMNIAGFQRADQTHSAIGNCKTEKPGNDGQDEALAQDRRDQGPPVSAQGGHDRQNFFSRSAANQHEPGQTAACQQKHHQRR